MARAAARPARTRPRVLPNCSPGWRRHGAARVHACLEATGAYGELLATTLVDAGHQVSILNPAIIHHYAKSRLSRAKTDPVDADVIADYAAKEHPPLWTPLPRDVRELQALVRRLDALIGMQTDERNRRRPAHSPPRYSSPSTPSWRISRRQIGTVRQQIRQHMDQHPGLRAQRDLLTSIPGIGEATAALLLAELFNKAFTSARQAAAFAGVVPRPHDSGLHEGRRVMCKARPGSLAQRPLLSGHRRDPLQSQYAAARASTAQRRQAPDAHHRRRHAQTHSPRLRRPQIRVARTNPDLAKA